MIRYEPPTRVELETFFPQNWELTNTHTGQRFMVREGRWVPWEPPPVWRPGSELAAARAERERALGAEEDADRG